MTTTWTQHEDTTIQNAVIAEVPLSQIRKILPKRSEASLRRRVTEIYAKDQGVCPKCGESKDLTLGEICCKPPAKPKTAKKAVKKRQSKKWTQEEEENLLLQLQNGKSLAEILKTTTRKRNSIIFRIAKLVKEGDVILSDSHIQTYGIGALLRSSMFETKPLALDNDESEELTKLVDQANGKLPTDEQIAAILKDAFPPAPPQKGNTDAPEEVDANLEAIPDNPPFAKEGPSSKGNSDYTTNPRYWTDAEDTELLRQLRADTHKYDIRIEGKNPPQISERIRVLDKIKTVTRRTQFVEKRPQLNIDPNALRMDKAGPGPNLSHLVEPVYSVPMPKQLDAIIHRGNTSCVKCKAPLFTSAYCKECYEEFDMLWTEEVFDHSLKDPPKDLGVLPDRGDDFIHVLPTLFQKSPGETFVDAIGGTGQACLAAQTMNYQEIVYNDPDDSSAALVTQLKGGEKTRKNLFILVNKIQHRHSFGLNPRDDDPTKAARRYLRIRGSAGIWAGDFTNPATIKMYEHLEVNQEATGPFLQRMLDEREPEKTLFFINLLRLPPGIFSHVAKCVRDMPRCIVITPDSIDHVKTFGFLPHQYYLTHKGYLIFSSIQFKAVDGMLEVTKD